MLVALLGVLTFQAGFRLPYNLAIAIVCGMDWLLVNLLNRLVDTREDVANQVVLVDIPPALAKRGAIALLLLAAASFPIVWFLEPSLLPWRVIAWGLAISYNYRLPIIGKRLKDRLGWKNVASASGFLLTVFAYPLAPHLMSATLDLRSVLIVGVFFFLFELSFEVLYDLRDMAGDAQCGVKTFPVVFGESWARQLTNLLLLLSAITLLLGFYWGTPWRLSVMVLAPVFQSLYLALRSGSIRERDCVALTTICASMLGFYNLWISLRLPYYEF